MKKINISNILVAIIAITMVSGCSIIPCHRRASKTPPPVWQGPTTITQAAVSAPAPAQPVAVTSAQISPAQAVQPVPTSPSGVSGGVPVLFVNKTNMVTVVATPNSFSKYRGTFILKLPNGCSIFLIPASEPGEYEYTWRAVEGLATGHATLMVDDKPIHYYSGTGAEGSFHAVATIGDQ